MSCARLTQAPGGLRACALKEVRLLAVARGTCSARPAASALAGRGALGAGAATVAAAPPGARSASPGAAASTSMAVAPSPPALLSAPPLRALAGPLTAESGHRSSSHRGMRGASRSVHGQQHGTEPWMGLAGCTRRTRGRARPARAPAAHGSAHGRGPGPAARRPPSASLRAAAPQTLTGALTCSCTKRQQSAWLFRLQARRRLWRNGPRRVVAMLSFTAQLHGSLPSLDARTRQTTHTLSAQSHTPLLLCYRTRQRRGLVRAVRASGAALQHPNIRQHNRHLHCWAACAPVRSSQGGSRGGRASAACTPSSAKSPSCRSAASLLGTRANLQGSCVQPLAAQVGGLGRTAMSCMSRQH